MVKKVLTLFQRGFERKLLFQVSSTGQLEPEVTMKTQMSAGVKGYPDETYLVRVTEQFQQKGVFLNWLLPQSVYSEKMV